MAAKGLVVITGIREIDRRLKRLEPAVQKKILRKAIRSGLKLVAEEVKARAPVDKGALRKGIKVRACRRRKRGAIELEVRIAATDETKRTSKKSGKTVFYPAIVEYGRNDKLSGSVPPNPFMRQAFEARGEAARQVTLAALLRGVEQESSRK